MKMTSKNLLRIAAILLVVGFIIYAAPGTTAH